MSSPIPPTRPLCIIGESDPFLARLLQRFAEKSGFRIQVVQTGDDVLGLIQQIKPALLILEPELPGKMRGWEVARSLRGSIPILICSWMNKTEVQVLIGQIPAHLQKPDLRYEDFTEALKSAEKKRNSRRKRTGATPSRKAAAE
jgi:DNA-binding response OmpR family regulator